MNKSYSLRRITCAGSKGMISARNIKAPHCNQKIKRKKKEKQPWKRVEFLSGAKISKKVGFLAHEGFIQRNWFIE